MVDLLYMITSVLVYMLPWGYIDVLNVLNRMVY
jgi:hypothetical protein